MEVHPRILLSIISSLFALHSSPHRARLTNMVVASSTTEATPKAKTSSSTGRIDAADAYYTFDADDLEALRKSAPWKDDAKWFDKVAVSPSAIMKMVRTISVSRLHVGESVKLKQTPLTITITT